MLKFMKLDNEVHLVGCGILKKEIKYLLDKHKLPVKTVFYDSALHCDLERLEKVLRPTLNKYSPENTVIFYGSCHPQLDQMLQTKGMVRTAGQNCIQMLLGYDDFMHRLGSGAFFLLEEWAQRWEQIVYRTMGTHRVEVIREIYQMNHSHLLALRTPCSDDYEIQAQVASELVGLPLEWLDIGLDHLAETLERAFRQIEAHS